MVFRGTVVTLHESGPSRTRMASLISVKLGKVGGGLITLSCLSMTFLWFCYYSLTGPAFRSGTTALDLVELEQVLRDEELARRLQEEEERLVAEAQHPSSPLTSRDCPVGDFRAAQVAQDEVSRVWMRVGFHITWMGNSFLVLWQEIARFMQKQEIKVKRSSRELESAGQECWEIERRATCDRQRRRLDSEGLRSPVDDFSPDHPGQMSTPV